MKNTTKLLNLLSAFMAVIGVCAAVLVCFIVIYTGINGGFSPKSNNSSSQTTINNVDPDFNIASANEEISQENSLFETKTNSGPVKSGTYTIDDIEFWFSDAVMNDVTGKWRISSIASSKDITEYVIDYYNTLFSSDDEIHAIVNFSLNTTTSISVLPDGMLDIAIHEYIDGEEHDAKVLFGGMLLKEYFFNPQNGELEEIAKSSSVSPVEPSMPNVIYSYEVPIENSTQMAIDSVSAETNNNTDTYSALEFQATNLDSNIVWLSATGLKYHSINNCGKMNPTEARQVSLEYAISEGYEKCSNCF